jgi:predicted nuclease of predicted toxin-antitoxin system
MRLLLDQGLPRSAVQHLAAAGIDAVHVAELGLSAAEDVDIVAEARRQQRIIVTLDADFHAILALSGAADPSVIRVRIEGLKGDVVAALLLDVLKLCEPELTAGAMVTVGPHRVRVRCLPLIR